MERDKHGVFPVPIRARRWRWRMPTDAQDTPKAQALTRRRGRPKRRLARPKWAGRGRGGAKPACTGGAAGKREGDSGMQMLGQPSHARPAVCPRAQTASHAAPPQPVAPHGGGVAHQMRALQHQRAALRQSLGCCSARQTLRSWGRGQHGAGGSMTTAGRAAAAAAGGPAAENPGKLQGSAHLVQARHQTPGLGSPQMPAG